MMMTVETARASSVDAAPVVLVRLGNDDDDYDHDDGGPLPPRVLGG